MKSILNTYWLSLTLIMRNISLLYKNFFHWNASKIVIWAYAFVFATILSLPAIGLIVWAGYVVLSPVPEASLSLFTTSGSIDNGLLGALMGHSWILLGVGILFVKIIAIFGFTLTYAYFLEIKLYESYLAGTKLPIFKNLFFSRYHLQKFLGILGWTSLYVLPPIVTGITILFVLFLATHFGLLNPGNQTHSLILGGISLVGFVVCVVWMTLLAIRMTFGYMMLLDKENKAKTARSFVTDSLALTKGKIFKMLFLILPFLAIIGTVGGFITGTGNKILIGRAETAINAIAKADPKTFVDDHSYIKHHFLNAFALNETDIARIIAINNAFNPKTDGVDPQYLEAIFPYLDNSAVDPDAWKIESIFTFLGFLITEGAMVMVYFSIFGILRKPATVI